MDDSFSTYPRWEASEMENEELWKGREFFRKMYESRMNQKADFQNNSEKTPILYDLGESTLKLYESDGIGFRYIRKYFKAWLKYKISKRSYTK